MAVIAGKAYCKSKRPMGFSPNSLSRFLPASSTSSLFSGAADCVSVVCDWSFISSSKSLDADKSVSVCLQVLFYASKAYRLQACTCYLYAKLGLDKKSDKENGGRNTKKDSPGKRYAKPARGVSLKKSNKSPRIAAYSMAPQHWGKLSVCCKCLVRLYSSVVL